MEKPRVPASHGKQAAIALVGSVAITLAMYLIPSQQNAAWLLAPFRWLHIYVHEYGHGIAALLTGGSFDNFELYTYSGVAHVRTAPGGLVAAFVGAGGLCGPAVVGGAFLALGRHVRVARWVLGAFGAFMAVSLVLWTRTPFGWGFGGAVALLSLGIAFKAPARLAQTVLVFLGVQLALSVYTGGGYLFTRSAEIQSGYKGPSDTEAMSQALGMPYWFWGAICAAFSAVVLLAGLWLYIRATKQDRVAPRAAARFAVAK